MNFKIEKVLERDIDLLVINNIINGKLTKLFLDKTNLTNYEVINVEHSYTDIDLGETDITVIVKNKNHKVGLLIENKINAKTMYLQPKRYIKRGQKGISEKKYNDFKTIIIAPKDYLNTNSSSKEYDYQISYEELLKVLSNDIYSKILINKAIEEKKQRYTVIENEMVTKFWKNYYNFIKTNYPTIKINEINGPRGSNASWPVFQTDYKQVIIIHKSNKGCVDLTFNGTANHISIFNKYIKNLPDDLKIVQTGKSLAIRINVPMVNFKNDFNDYINEMHKCIQGILKLYNTLSKINVLMLYEQINKNI